MYGNSGVATLIDADHKKTVLKIYRCIKSETYIGLGYVGNKFPISSVPSRCQLSNNVYSESASGVFTASRRYETMRDEN